MSKTVKEKLLQITRQLLPSGRAFHINENSLKHRIESAFILSQERFYNDALSILDSILPDNDNFTADDATRWEQRLGLITNSLVPLADRKAAIIRKMNHPGNILARQSAGYIQDQLQLAGFNVFVHENLEGLSPESLLILPLELGEMGDTEMDTIEMGDALSYYPDLFDDCEMGEPEMGELEMGEIAYNNLCVNYIDENLDSNFNVGQNYLCTFVIGGEEIGTFADVDSQRKNEFRQLILKLKPTQTVALLFINYI